MNTKQLCVLIVDELLTNAQTNISTQKEKKEKNPRLSSKKEKARRPGSSPPPAEKRAVAPGAMTGLAIKTKQRTSDDKPLLIAVSTKVSKKATVRNLLKRRLRAIMRPILKHSQYTYLIIVKSEAIKMNYQELKNEVSKKIPNYV